MNYEWERLWPWVGIVGSRKLEGSAEARAFIRRYLTTFLVGRIVSGGAVGIDSMAIAEARALGYEEWQLVEHRPEHVLQGPRTRENWITALFARNTLIAQDSDILLAIMVPGGSRGTTDTIDKAKSMGKPVIQVEFDAPNLG